MVNPFLDEIERDLSAGKAKEAKKRLAKWVKENKTAPDRDRAIFLLADADFRLDARIKAFYQLDELLDKYPESRLFRSALEKQYEIAGAFLEGYKRKILGMRILSADDEAVDMMFRIQERAPGSPLAERCLLRTADYYFAKSDFDLAFDAYAAFVRSYPRSPELPRVRLKQAFSSYAQFRGPKFDATPLIDARAQFEDIKNRYPELASENNVQKFIDGVNETLARKLYIQADFYRRTDKPRAAVYTMRQLIRTYPNSKEAQLAKAELPKMPAAALREPTPATTRPAEPPGAIAPAGPPRPGTELGPRPSSNRSP